MKTHCLVLAAVLAISATMVAADAKAPIYTIDLDLAPDKRWYEPTLDLIHTRGWNNTMAPVLEYMTTLIPLPIINLLEPLLVDLDNSFGDYGQEIRGVWQAFQDSGIPAAREVSLGELVGINIVYSLSAFCTSIVGQDSEGVIWHGRNLDYPIPGLSNISSTVIFTKNGETQYYGSTFMGYVGLLTGMKPGVLSVSLDERGGSDPFSDILENVESFLKGGKFVGMFLRTTIAEATSFADALVTLNQTQLISPEYLIVGGVNAGEGAIITRDRNHANDTYGYQNGVWMLDPPTYWWRLETNYDHWNAPPKYDDRRDPANNLMAKMGPSNLNPTNLYNVLSTPPILNPRTKYTTIMSAKSGYFTTTARDHDK